MTEEKKTAPKKKKKMGRPRGSITYYTMKNGVFKKDDLFLYAPEDTIPKGEIRRFLQQCDNMLMLLDARTVNQAELEEIAKVYREGVIVDAIFRGLTQGGDENANGSVILDATTINSLDKILKTVEKRKENLAIRARDAEKARNLSSQVTMMDVVSEVGSEVEKMENESKIFNRELEEAQEKLTKTEDFMGERVGHIDTREDSISDSN